MPLTLAQLRTTMTRAQCLDSLITVLDSLGFNATSWQSGSIQRTVLEGAAEGWAQLTAVVAALTRLAYNDDATDDALTAFSTSHYDNTRTAATLTVGYCTLTCSAFAGPYAIVASQLVASDSINGYTYRNTTGGLLASGGTLQLTFTAEVAGAARNVADNTITTLQTALAGVTINNPAVGTSWRITDAVDAETDATLRQRNTSRWATLSYASPDDAYRQFALTASANITRVYVDDSNPGGANTVYVWCASSTGPSAAPDVTLAQTAFNLKRPCTSAVTAFAAIAQAQAFTFQCWIETAKNNAATQALILAAITGYVNGLDIGGTYYPGGAVGYCIHSELVDAVSSIDGVEAVTFTVPVADVAFTTRHHVMVGTFTPTYTSI